MSMKPRTVLQLSFKEYTEAWVSVIYEFYQQGVCSEELQQEMALTEDQASQFSLEYGTVLLTAAILCMDAKPKLVVDRAKTELINSIVRSFYSRMISDADAQTLDSCKKFFDTKMLIFGQICRNIYSTNPQKRQTDALGFARYILSQVSDRSEEKNTGALKELGILITSASDAFIRLVINSAQNSTGNKPSFSVQK